MSDTEQTKTTTPTESRSPLMHVAVGLCGLSATWTAYSSWDLLDRHHMAMVAGATYDILWMSLVYADWKNRTQGKKSNAVVGWLMLVPVVVLLTWHGHDAWGVAGAIAGPLLAIGTKVLLHKAIEDSIDEITIKKAQAAKAVALVNTEADIILEQAGAEIRKDRAKSEADHRKTLDEKRRAHELKMADQQYAQEEQKAAQDNRTDLILGSVENAAMEKVITYLERLTNPNPSTIQGETVPQQVAGAPAPQALGAAPQPASVQRPKMVTYKIDQDAQEPLTEAQQAKRRMAALFYLYEDDAAAQGEKLTQTAYALRVGATKLQVSRACSAFPRESIGDIEVYREEMKKTG